MDLISCITALTSCITAIATAVTVIVSVKQFKKSLEENQSQLRDERLSKLKDQALYVDAWIVVPNGDHSNEHKIVLKNGTQGCIRDVTINVGWRDYRDKTNSSRCSFQTIPPGYWIISKNYSLNSFEWNFPESISVEKLLNQYAPRFKNDNQHIINKISFDDMYGERWGLDLATRELTKIEKPQEV